jgi:hypothetical protein
MPPILQDIGTIVWRGVHDVTDPLDIDQGSALLRQRNLFSPAPPGL